MQELRYRMRYLDMIMNAPVRNKFMTRTRIISGVRRFLDNLGFLEVSALAILGHGPACAGSRVRVRVPACIRPSLSVCVCCFLCSFVSRWRRP
jgi:lysyl-tRNA synthetase class II